MSKVYSIFGKSGMMEEIKEISSLPFGLKVVHCGAGSCEQTYCVCSEPDSNGVQRLALVSKFNIDYSSAPFHNLDKYTQPLSAKFGIGFYYDDVENHVFSAEEVKQAIERAEKAALQIKENAAEKELAKRKELNSLPAKFPYLTPAKSGNDEYKEVKVNVIADLKYNFPSAKFSVTKKGYSHIYVSWTNGPSLSAVNAVINKYQDHHSDETGDFWDYTPSNFNCVFGGLTYVSSSRIMTDEIKVLSAELEKLTNCNEIDRYEAENILYKIWYNTDIPVNAFNFRIEKTDCKAGSLSDFYRIAFDVPAIPALPAGPESDKKISANNTASSSLELVDYSEKAVALFGDTREIKDQLKEIGGRFNPYLTRNGAKVPGWIFSKSKADQVRELINNSAA